MAVKPRDSVFTTVMWDGEGSVADFVAHLARLKNHAERLRIELPSDLDLTIAKAICELGEGIEKTQRQLLTISYSNSDNLDLTSRPLPKLRSSKIHGKTKPLHKWLGDVTGTKHGDWKPYLDARDDAEQSGADISILVDDFTIVDTDRASIVVIDEDGAAYVSDSRLGVDGITNQIVARALKSIGIPVMKARLNERMVARCEEILVTGTGIGCSKLVTIDGEMIGREKSLIFERCRDILAQHYSNPDTWTNMCEYLQ
ncbi:MAG: aminotransferase class IV [Candidatus Poseidoniaceae archaeon]|nr:aminotransferase class IV [Candidatus Poseidoniaceae archaeon]MBL6895918.1 aminotransferase class IV [Candidatus Poseidoniaceae archaeon]